MYNGFEFPVGKQYEDVAVTPFILTNAKNIKYIPYPMYYYLQREKSIVATNTYMSAFYKICSNISEVIKNHDNDCEKYKLIINEFFVRRILDMITQDYNANKKEFESHLEGFKKDNKNTIEYIINTNMVNTEKNDYSERQKQLVTNMFIAFKNGNIKSIKNNLIKRKIINYFRNILVSLKTFLKSIINK